MTENTPLPSQKAVLTVAANKKQLVSIICNDIVKDASFCCRHTSTNKLEITGSSNVPTEIHRGVVIARPDIATSHEEADNITVQEAVVCKREVKYHGGSCRRHMSLCCSFITTWRVLLV